MLEEFLNVARKELGYKEGKNNASKYGKWYGLDNNPWCAMFVSWCANQVGILGSKIPKYASSSIGYNWFKSRGLATSKPKPGYVGFLKGTTSIASHTFIVEAVDGKTITTIEGNLNDKVMRYTRKLSDKDILGFGIVDLGQDAVTKYVIDVDDEGLVVHKSPAGSNTGELLKAGTPVKVYENQGYWSKIDEGKWVWSFNLSKNCPKTKKVFNVKKPPLNVRAGYKLGTKEYNKVIGKLYNGDVVQVYKTKNGWCKVSKEEERWVAGNYLK